MGIIGDIFQGQVVLKYKADTEQAKIALRELSGEQKKNAQQAVQGIEDQLKAHERLAAKITVGMGIAAGAIAIGIKGFEAYEQRVRLSTASAGADMNALRAASHGLLTDMDLMKLAAEGMNGKFKLTSSEMETVLAAAVALEARGIAPLGEATQKLGEAVKKGEIDPLKDLGIAYDENLAKTDKRGAALKALTALSNESAGATDAESDAIRQSGVAFKNSMAMVEESIGRLVVSFGPMIQAVADLAAQVANLADAASHIPGIKLPGGLSVGGMAKFIGRAGMSPLMWSVDAARGLYAGFSDTSGGGDVSYLQSIMGQAGVRSSISGGDGVDGYGVLGAPQGTYNGPYNKVPGFPGAKTKPVKTMRGGGGSRGGGESQIIKAAKEWLASQVPAEGTYEWQLLQVYIQQQEGREDLDFGELGTEGIDALLGGGSGKRGPRRDAAGFAVGKGGTAYGVSGADKSGPSFMEKMLGPVDQFDAYATAWGGFQNAVTSGYEALVTGSESFGKAAKRVIGQTIMAEGSHMLVLALREGAQAIASLAGGNFAAAGTHGLAAAKFGAGAALAGVVAHSLGAGGSSAAAGAGASASGVGTSGVSNDNAPRNTNIVLGHGWDDETNRQRAARFARAQRQASSYEGAPVGVVYG